MKKICMCLLLCTFPFLTIYSQEVFSKLGFSGYRVVIIPSESFDLKTINGFDADQEIDEDGVMHYTVKDQTGRVPKDTLYLYTNKLESLDLHNCELVMNKVFCSDSLFINMVSSFGELNVIVDFLDITVSAGSTLSAKGQTAFLSCTVGAGSYADMGDLKAKEAELDVRGYSSLKVNSEKVIKKNVKNGSIKDVYKE